ncbi:DMT family transporter [Rhodococcus sp. X156]|uniref:DMT family transporter n=1 Tax=Rhodococcus sp. X156 TaxID=2499145 RepID=UPI001F49E549|nr:DMT family transporter [Rhodococcus sp. X156]
MGAGATILGLTSILYELSATTPSTGAFFRCLYAVVPLGLLVLLRRRRDGRPTTGGWSGAAVGAGVFLGLDLLLWHHAINEIGAGLATVLISLQVVFAAGLGYLVLRQRVSPRLWWCLPVLLLGVALVGGLTVSGLAVTSLSGFVGAVVAAAAYAVYIVGVGAATRRARQSSGPMLVSTMATAVTVGLVGLWDGSLDLTPPAAAHGWLVLLALDAQVLGWLLVSRASQRLPASSVAAGLVLQSTAALGFAALLLHQLPTTTQTVGAGLVLAAVTATVSTRASRTPDLTPKVALP